MRDLRNADVPLHAVWAVIEQRHAVPLTLVVTGATASDDTASVARGVAAAAAAAGRRVVFASLEASGQSIANGEGYEVLSIGENDREAIDGRIGVWRALHEVVVIDVPRLPSASLGPHLSRVADAVVVAVCDGRPVVAQDAELIGFLERVGSAVPGVVLTGPAQQLVRERSSSKELGFARARRSASHT